MLPRSVKAIAAMIILFAGCRRSPSGSTGGYEPTTPEEANITVEVRYHVRDVVDDIDRYYFKQCKQKRTRNPDGSTRIEFCSGVVSSSKVRDGMRISSYGAPEVDVSDAGIHVTLDLSWRGQDRGEIHRELQLAPTDTHRTMQDQQCKLEVLVTRKA
jgi:hypothetical protein